MFTIFLIACGNKEESFGTKPAPDSKILALSELLKTPEKFHKKEVTLQGVVDGQCGNRCEFFYREKTDAVTIYMGGIEAPVIQKGTPVIVETSVHLGKEKLVLTAKGFTLKPKGGL